MRPVKNTVHRRALSGQALVVNDSNRSGSPAEPRHANPGNDAHLRTLTLFGIGCHQILVKEESVAGMGTTEVPNLEIGHC